MFDISILADFAVPVVVGICICVGYIIKNVVSNDEINNWIPLIMGVLGVFLNIWISGTFNPGVLLGGLVSGLASTGLYEAIRNFLGV